MRLVLAAIFLLFSNLINAQWVQTNGPYGGDVRCFAISGSNIFAGTIGGGVFLSTNNGNNWSPVNNGLTNPNVYSLAISGSNVLAGTLFGLFISYDNGNSWTEINNPVFQTQVSALTIDGTNIFAGTAGGVFISSDSGITWNQVNNGLTNTQVLSIATDGSKILAGTYDGVFISTNNGNNWSQVNNGLPLNSAIHSIAIKDTNIFVGAWGNFIGGIYLSTDNGNNWTSVNNGLTPNAIAYSLAINDSNIFAGVDGGIYLSSNYGSNWTPINNGLPNGLPNLSVNALAINGSDIFAGSTIGGVFFSNDSGNNWTISNNGIVSTNVFQLAKSDSNLFAGTQRDGVFLSTDNGNSWIPKNNGLADLEIRALGIKDSNIFISCNNEILLSNNNGNNWTTVYNQGVNVFAFSGSNIFAGNYTGAILSTNNGNNWVPINNGLTTTEIYAFAIRDSNIFAGTNGGGVFLSTNNGGNWTAVNNGLGNLGISALAIKDSLIFAGTGNGLFLSTDNGNNWTGVSMGWQSNYQVTSISISKSDIFVGTYVGGVFHSTNNGSTWTEVNTGLSRLYINSSVILGSNLYVGINSMGVWRYHIPSSIIQGRVYSDKNSNCIFDSIDAGLSSFGHSFWIVEATKAIGSYFSAPDSLGYYTLIADTGNYSISLINPAQAFTVSCPPTGGYQVQLISDTDTIGNIDFGLQSQISCSQMRTIVNSSFFRPCMSSTINVEYCNEGTIAESNTVLKINLPPELTLTSSSIPWNSVAGNTYTYNIGLMQALSCGSITVSVDVLCDTSVINATLCIRAEISPAEFCQPVDTAWDKSSVHVTGECDGDSLVCFTITNTGSSVNGNMQGPSQWRLYADNVLVQQGTFQLLGGNDTTLCFVANGQTLRLNADQRPYHPGHSHPNANVERCGILTGGQTYSLSQILQTPINNGLPFVSDYCAVVRTSYDPNDKQVIPEGMTGNHFIRNEDRLDYKINFQNTGNDTAFTVVIRDTLDLNSLDISTIVLGTASHQYDFSVEGQGVLVWRFENILLPDSTINESLSHGYMSFSIDQLPGLAMGTQVMNHADIYFDFNPPVTTNTVINTVCVSTQPVISFNGNQLESTIGSSYQWFLDGFAITGAVSQTYTPLSLGNYTVEVLDINGCSAISNPYNLLTLSIPSVISSAFVATLFPNPTANKTSLSILPNVTGKIQIVLIGITGQEQIMLFEKRVEQNQTLQLPIDTDMLKSGVYIVQIKIGDNLRYLRMMVLK